MSLQTNVFEDGRWVTRNLDPYYARAQNSRREETSPGAKAAAKAPSLGLLTRTIVGSSVVKQITPARMRHRTKNDVLFISANSVEIKEAFGNYVLRNVMTVTDFDAPIRAAKILGEPRKADQGDRYSRSRRDTTTKWEIEEPILGINDEGNLDNASLELPPHVLVLTLATSKIVFLCSLHGNSDCPRLLWGQHPLPAARWANEQLGEHLAVDPRSRAMAVSAHEGGFYVYTLKSMVVLTQEFRDGLGLCPIKEERLILLEGTILKMEFLHPSQNDPGQIILLIIVCHKGKAKMTWYEWSSNITLRESQMQPNRYALPPEEQLPLVLVPLIGSTAFMIVCEAQLTIYRDILTGTPTRCVQSSLDLRRPEEPGSSKRLPLWTQWARPMRPKGHPETNVEDAIYLAREDGIVQYLEFRNKSDHMLDCTHQAGSLGVNIDAAFAVLDVGPNTGDLLVAGGVSSEGGLWRMWPREDPEFLSAIANWTPLRNLMVTHHNPNPENSGKGTEVQLPSPLRLFACTGEGKYGTVSELRCGSQASARLSTVIAGDMLNSGVLAVWAFHGFFGDPKSQFDGPESRNDATYIVISFPMETSLLRVQLEPLPTDYTQQQSEQDPGFIVEEIDLDIATSTLYTTTTAAGLLVLITRESIVACCISTSKLKKEPAEDVEMENGIPGTKECSIISRFDLPDSNARIVAANALQYAEMSVLFLAVQVGNCFSLHVGYLTNEYVPRKEVQHMDSQPSCVLLQTRGSDLYAFVATTNNELFLFRIDDQGLIGPMPTAYRFEGSFAICDSIAIIESNESEHDRPEYLVVCGLRNGTIQTLHWTINSSKTFILCAEIPIGNTSVSVLTDHQQRSRAILQCEQSFCTLEFPKGTKFRATPMIENIWITNPNRPALQQGILAALSQVTDSWVPGGLPGLFFGSLICVDANQLHIIDLDHRTQPRSISRRLQTNGNPHKIAYSTYLKKIIALSEKLNVTQARKTNINPNLLGMRVPETSVTFLDPDKDAHMVPSIDASDIKQEDHARKNDQIALELQPTEHVVGMFEWFPKIGDSVHHSLIVYTKLQRRSKLAGRLLYYDVRERPAEDVKLELKRHTTLIAPIYSMIAHPDQRSVIYCSGNELCIRTLAPSPSGSGVIWQEAVKAVMRSPGRALTVNEPYIYVSSARESLAVFKYTEGKLVYQYGDQTARDGLHHVLVPEHDLVLASDMMNTVVGLWQPPERRIDNAMTTVFEAILPSSINRLQPVTRPVWYRDPRNPQEDKSIIGSSEDGTITQFDILTTGWRILRFIQNMAERNETVCPLKDFSSYKRRVDPLATKPHHMHINGDIIQRVLERGAETLIKEMLDVEPDREWHTDFDSAKMRWERFKELAAEVVDTGNADWLTELVHWIRYRLRSAL